MLQGQEKISGQGATQGHACCSYKLCLWGQGGEGALTSYCCFGCILLHRFRAAASGEPAPALERRMGAIWAPHQRKAIPSETAHVRAALLT